MTKVVLAHDFLTQRGGAERVFLAMAQAWPDSPILTTVYNPATTYPDFARHEVRTSPLQRIAPLRRNFRAGLPLYPWAFRRLGPVDADVVLSSSTSFAHGIRSAGCHISYFNSPPRWLWETERYSARAARSRLARPLFAWLRLRDHQATSEPHLILANSHNAAGKIHDVYGRWPEVLPPPVRPRPAADEVGDYFLVVSRLLPYKRIDVAIAAAGQLGARLVVVGKGPDSQRLRGMAGPGVEFREHVPDAELDALYARCVALVMPGQEDLGLVPIEANTAGRPAVCWARGGALETVVPEQTGFLVDGASPSALAAGMAAARDRVWDTAKLQAHAAQWSEPTFVARLQRLVEDFPGWCRRCGGAGLGPEPLRALLEKHGQADLVLPNPATGAQQ
ncbi:MAG: glycosyltransferase [Actinobacteria bacterium]|nr:glycosyltransferase [Actinomycetota bacterium]